MSAKSMWKGEEAGEKKEEKKKTVNDRRLSGRRVGAFLSLSLYFFSFFFLFSF